MLVTSNQGNANETREIPPHTQKWLKFKKTDNTKC